MNKKTVSLIIPCYNSEEFIENTLGFVLNQYYSDIQVICVNDGSTDGTVEIIQKYAGIYKNIQLVDLKENRGLFAARIAGAEAATGDYILFLDSDDEITPGWVSALVRKAEAEGADIVLGDVKKKGDLKNKQIDPKISSYQNLEPLHLIDLDTDGSGMIDILMRIHGLCSHFHYIWNKLIRRDLWQACLADFAKLSAVNPHHVMGEDLAFSATLYCHAKKVCNIHNEYYIYCFHDGQSARSDSIEKYLKNVSEIIITFNYFEELLKTYGYYEKYANEFKMFKQRYGIIYLRAADSLKLPRRLREHVEKLFLQDEIENEKRVKTEFFFSLMTNTSPIYEEYTKLMRMLFSDEVEVVSFDLFDTLALRPFGDPLDMFNYLEKPFAELFKTTPYVNFASQRIVAEDITHRKQKINKPGIEEPTLDDIYDTLSEIYGYDREKLRKIENIEQENEVRFLYPRKFAKDIFELAKELGKRVIIVSDMYLPRGCVEAILDKLGLYGYEKLYLSSEVHLTKHHGTLYKYILKDLGDIKPSHVLHIGDNYRSDIENAKSNGLKAVHLPRTITLFRADNPGIYTGKCYHRIFRVGDRYRDMSLAYHGFAGMRSLCAIAANEIFDFPYVSYNKNSDFNADPRYIGYFALGMHIYAVARWLIENVRGKGYRKIHFAARDGYIIKKAYDILAEGENDLPESNYIRISRKAFAIADINCIQDMHSLVYKLNFVQQTPDSVYDLFAPVMSEESKARYAEYSERNPGRCQTNFIERFQFDEFLVQFYKDYLFDADFKGYQAMLKKHFGETFKANDVLFDIGYSGRIEMALNKLLGYKIKSFYLHINNDLIDKRKNLSDIENSTFYDYKPAVTGIIREHILSEMCPSTIGYTFEDGEFKPVFDEYDIDFPTQFVTYLMQESAIKFVSDVKTIFGKDALDLYCRLDDVSRPFEYYMHFSRNFDRRVFADSEFEDDFGEGHQFSGLDFWNRALARGHDDYVGEEEPVPVLPEAVKNKSRLLRALYFFIYDRQKFKEKLKNKFGKGSK